MSENPHTVDIPPQDNENSRAIMEKIRKEKITDEATIRAIVNSYKFSSSEIKKHFSDRMIDLFSMGAFNPNNQPLKPIEFDAADTDAHI